jgi:hypothetical protein
MDVEKLWIMDADRASKLQSHKLMAFLHVTFKNLSMHLELQGNSEHLNFTEGQ